jgi:hypothetical protein
MVRLIWFHVAEPEASVQAPAGPGQWLNWLGHLRLARHPWAATRHRPAMFELLDAASVNVETVHDRLRASLDRRQPQPQPDWADLLERVEYANESLRRAIESLGYKEPAARHGSVDIRPMTATVMEHGVVCERSVPDWCAF